MSTPPIAVPSPRRRFLATTLVLGSGLLAPMTALAQAGMVAPADTTARKAPKPPPLPDELVKEFVGAAHGDMAKTRSMLDAEPGLLNATWDWKAGDFETGLGGAGHMGRRDIAEFLISRGARMDLFVAAMLGHLDVVRSMLIAYPSLALSKGPHGITLLRHAEAGGEHATEVARFLRELPKG